MLRSDRCLQSERTWPAIERLFHERERFRNLRVIPARAILIFKENKFASFIQACIAAGIVKQHQREEPGGFGRRFGRHQASDEPAKTNRFRGEISANEALAAGGCVAFVEDQINYGENCIQLRRQIALISPRKRDRKSTRLNSSHV